MENNQLVTRQTFSPIEKAMQEAGFSPEKVKQEISFAIQHINKSNQLQKCTKESLLQAVVNISNIGLSLNPAAKEAYLIPRWNNTIKVMEASLEPGYIGLVKLLTDSGSVTSMLCQLVYANDFFEMEISDNIKPVIHKPERDITKRGELIGAYALASLPNGTRQAEYMSKTEITEIQGRSETFKAYVDGKIKSCTWVSDFGEMARKTVIKRIYKYLPRTEKMDRVDHAVLYDNSDYVASVIQIGYIETLLSTSCLDDRARQAIEMETSVMTSQRAGQVIEYLKDNQLNASQGNLGTQKQVSREIKRFA